MTPSRVAFTCHRSRSQPSWAQTKSRTGVVGGRADEKRCLSSAHHVLVPLPDGSLRLAFSAIRLANSKPSLPIGLSNPPTPARALHQCDQHGTAGDSLSHHTIRPAGFPRVISSAPSQWTLYSGDITAKAASLSEHAGQLIHLIRRAIRPDPFHSLDYWQ